MKTLKISALAALAALSLAACDSDGGTGPTGLPRGQFEGGVSGVLDIAVDGEAVSGYWTNPNFQDIIVLTDYVEDLRVVIYESEDEFFEGRWNIGDEDNINSRIIAYVEDLRTGESFGSVSGTIDIADARSSGIEGSALFTAESDLEPGDYVTVDVVFNTDYDGGISVNRIPSFSRSQKP